MLHIAIRSPFFSRFARDFRSVLASRALLFPLPKEPLSMMIAIVAASSLLAVFLTLTLAREVRLRRAL